MRKIRKKTGDICGMMAASALALMLCVSTSTAYTNITTFGSSSDGDGGFTNSPPTGTEAWFTDINSVNYSFGTIGADEAHTASLMKEYTFDHSSGNSYSIEGVVTLTDGYGDDNNRIGILLFHNGPTQTGDGGGGLWLRLNTDNNKDISISTGINGSSLASTNTGVAAGDSWIGQTLTFTGTTRFVGDFITIDFTLKDANDVEYTTMATVPAADYTNGAYFGFVSKWRQRGNPSSNRDVPPSFDYNSFSIVSIPNPPDTTPPSAPANVVASAEEFTVNLTWDAVAEPDVLYYNVYRSETSGSYSTNPIASSVTSTNYMDTGLTNGTTYYYVITAVDNSVNANESANSPEVSATPILDIIPPGSPTNLVAEAFDRKILLQWDAPGDPDVGSYNIYRSVSGNPEAVLATNVLETQYIDEGLINGTLYTYRVTAVDDSVSQNESAKSDPASATPVQVVLPPPFTDWTQSTPTGNDDWGTTASSVIYTNKDFGTQNSSLLGEYVLNRVIGASYTITGVVRMVNGYADDNNRLGMYFFGDYKSISAADGGDAEDENGALGLIFNTDDNSSGGSPGNNARDKLSFNEGVDNGEIISTNRTQDVTPYAQDLFGTIVTFSTVIDFVAGTNDTTNIVITASMTTADGDVTQLDPLTVAAADYTGDYFGFVNRARARNYVEGVPGSATGRSLPWIMEYLDFSVTSNLSGYDMWALGWGTNDIGSATNDFDLDGLGNYYEYGLDGDPTNALDQGTLPVFSKSGSGFIYVHPKRSDDASVVYTVETTGNLQFGPWTATGYTVGGTDVTGGTLDFVTNTVDTTAAQKFIRLKVE